VEQSHQNTISRLNIAINNAIRIIADLKGQIKQLLEEKKGLQAVIAEKDKRIMGLQKTIEEMGTNSNDANLSLDQSTKDKLKSRIQTMLNSLDDFKLSD
jgi:predicted  nucleic acid-binding Zn-ribbon protein